jgi:hypothetical protein
MTTNEPTPDPTGPAWYRTRAGIISIVAAVAVLVIGGIAWAVTSSSDASDAGRATTTTRKGGATGRTGASGASGSSGASGATGSSGASGASGATGGKGTTTTTRGGPQPTGTTQPDVEVDHSKVQVELTPGSCRWNVDTLDLTARGNIRNLNPVDAVVSIDVTFLDGSGGEVDVASDLAVLGPAGSKDDTATWDVLGASVDAPTGGLSCEISLS